MVKNNITVQSSLMPFNNIFTTVTVKDCKTVDDVVKTSVPFNFADSSLIVVKNGEVVLEEDWKKTKVKEGDIIGLNFIPQGGGGGDGKNTAVQIVATIAIIVASVYLGPEIGAALQAGNYLEAAAYAGALAAATTGIQMAAQALMSTPKQPTRTSVSNISDSPTSFIDGARNNISKYGIIPVNLGTNRMFPYQASMPYTETSGKNQYVRQLFTYGYGKLIVSDRKFGETDITNFTEVEFDDRLNADLNQGTKLYANSVYQEDLNINVTNSGGYVLRTTQLNTSEVEIDLTFNGLCRYDSNGVKQAQQVDFEIQYAPTGTEDWSTGTQGDTVQNAQFFNIKYDGSDRYIFKNDDPGRDWRFATLSFYLNIRNGTISFYKNWTGYTNQYSTNVALPSLSSDYVLLGYVRGSFPHDFIDNRSNLVGKYIESLEDFVPTYNSTDLAGVEVSFSGGKILGGTLTSGLSVRDVTTSSVRKSIRFVFPEPGQYDIRIKRLTADSSSDSIFDKSYLTAVKSVSYESPVKFADISGSAMRIRATDQLSGIVDSYNVTVTSLIKSYNPETQEWEDDKPSSNPADIFRYVLQTPAFAKHVTDDRIDLEKLEEWWVYCNSLKLTYDRVIDYDTSVDDVLNDICAAGVATLSKVNNIFSVIIDNERPIIKGMVTPRNSWEYKGNINYPEIPHGLRIEFRNRNAGYNTDERIVYADGYNETNAELYERLQFASCTNADLAYWYGRRYFATALLQPETHTFKMDFEHMTFNRGDRITLVNDVILVGVGQGRIKELLVDNVDNPTSVLGFTIDDKVIIPSAINLGVRIRDNNARQGYKYHLLQAVEGESDTFAFRTPVTYSQTPSVGSLCSFVEDGKELDLIITGIKPDKNQSASITAIDYAPARFNPIGEIPEFNSQITISEDLYKPKPPELMSDIQTDESVMIRNSDGSLTSVAIIDLINRNGNDVIPYIRVRQVGTTEWSKPTSLKNDINQLVITGLQDGQFYDFDIRYQRQGGLQLLSDPLLIENIKFIGGSTPPKNVQNFRVTTTNGLALFEWSPNDDIDISHYVIKYSAEIENVTWEGAQMAMDKITSTSITNIIHRGMYLIKAVDMLGNESLEPTTIISTDSGAYNNVVKELIEDPTWLGVKDNVIVQDGVLFIDNDTLVDGYYYFNEDEIDLGEVYECSLSANIRCYVEKRYRVRDIDRIRNINVGIRDYGADWDTNVNWKAELEMNLSNDGENWTGWQTFVASQLKFRFIKLRLHLESGNVYVTPRVSLCRVVIDMPDRYESKTNLEITDAEAGYAVEYANAFWNNPAVSITIQNGAVDDRIEFPVKNNQGFTIKVFNATLNAYVTRVFDYIAAGYGKVV